MQDATDTVEGKGLAPAPLRALLGLLLVVAFVLTQGVVFGAVGALVGDGAFGDVPDGGSTLGLRGALAFTLVQVGQLAVALAVLRWRGGAGWRPPLDLARAWRGTRALAPVGLVVLVPGMLLALTGPRAFIAPSLGAGEAAALCLLAFAIAVNEEIWFRGLVVDALGGRAAPIFTAVCSGVLFGLPHYTGSAATLLNAVGVALAVGVPFAAVRLRCRDLAGPIAWHTAIDVWAFLHTASVTVSGSPGLDDALAALVLPAVLAVAYVAWLVSGAARDRVSSS